MGRGPSYPYVDLEQAISLTQKMWEFTKRAPAPLDSVVNQAWKYSPSSSSGQKVLAALKAFGLIEDVPETNGKSVKLTQRAIRVLLDDKDSAERNEEIRKAALSPKWYDFCWKKWGADMPASMKSYLLIEEGFVDSTVDGFLKDYKKSMAFAGLLNGDQEADKGEGSEESIRKLKIGDYVQWETQGSLRMPEAKRIASFLDEGKFALVEGSNNPVPVAELIAADAPESKLPLGFNVALKPTSTGEGKLQTETFALPDGVTGQLQWPAAMSQDAYEDFVYQLEGLKRRVSRAVRKEAALEAVSSEDEGQ